MGAAQGQTWPTCDEDECGGRRLEGLASCLAHAEDEQRVGALLTLREHLDLRGTTISTSLWSDVRRAIEEPDGTVVARAADFEGAHFVGSVDFRAVVFLGRARFVGAHFEGAALFQDAAFENGGTFREARFNKVRFSRTAFRGPVSFRRAVFGSGSFGGTAFMGHADFGETVINGQVRFPGARFEQNTALGPLATRGVLNLDSATFSRYVVVSAVAGAVFTSRATYQAGVTFELIGGHLIAEGTAFLRTSTLTRPRPWALVELSALSARLGLAKPIDAAPGPKVLSLRGTDVSMLLVANANLSDCLFAGAHNLDRLRLEGESGFRPAGGSAYSIVGLTISRPTRRDTLVEEHHWRSASSRPRSPALDRWADSEGHPLSRRGETLAVRQPGELASLYRQLRKAREDGKDEPGAADFYYGEMEMRRLDAARPRSERLILFLYWATSGYGLRASRALAVLIPILVALTCALRRTGFPAGQPVGWLEAATFVGHGVLPVGRNLSVLTPSGVALIMLTKAIAWPLLVLAVLSVRNRVKR